MKKLSAIITTTMVVSLFYLSACGQKTNLAESTSPEIIENTSNLQEEGVGRTITDPLDKEINSPSETEASSKLSVELGNDIGKDVIKLFIRPFEDDSWNEITLTENPWRSGFLIPIKLEAKEIPNPEDGWQILVEFSDATEQTFMNVDLNDYSLIILTTDEIIYSN